MPAIYHEGSWLGNATDPEVLVKDTVGWTGKNRAYSQTNNAVIAHIENGITYDVSWTGSATVTLKKNSTSGATITSGSTSPLSFTADADYELYFGSSATVTNIMVKDSRITDPTYEPYHESVEVMYEEEIHGVNLLKVDTTSQTINGLTVTVNADKSVKITGTASTATNVIIRQVNAATENILDDLEIGQKYIYSGCPIGGSNRTYAMVMNQRTVSGGNVTYKYDVGNGYEFTYDGTFTSYQMMMQIWPEAGNVNLTFNPMLRKADIEDSTYRPYNEQAIQNQLNAQGVLGAKNLLPITLSNVTESGVTFTKNDDNSITLNGTASTTLLGRKVSELTPSILPKGNYILSRKNISQGNEVHFALTKLSASGTYIGNLREANTTDNVLVTVDYNGYDKIGVIIWIRSGTVLNNYTIYPMLRLASDPDDTYQPYAMTNRELTEKIKTIVSEAVTEAFSAHSSKWHNNANDCNVGFERTNDSRTSNMPTTGTSTWYNIMTVRESNVPTSSSFGYGFQIAVQTTTNSTMGDTYVRAVNGGASPTWSEWKKLN